MFEHIDKELDAIVERLPQSREGFITPDQADFLYHFVLLTRPRIVAETGFHVGHSACVILKAMERYGGGTLISFDIARYEETTQAAEMVKARFEGFHLIAGDSKETLAGTLGQILSSNPGATLDFATVDGGHDIDTARSDMLIMETLLKPGGYLWLDDFESNKDRCVQVSIVGREFAMSRRHCLRFVTADHRGLMIYQKGF
jgi:predicted O-methyltransferase YrrM